MGKYSSDSDSSDIARGRHSKHSIRNKGRSRSSSAESGHRRLQPRHKKRCKGRRSRSKERYSRSRRHGGGKPRRSSSSSSSSDDSRRKNRRSPASSSSTTNSSCATPQAPPEVSSQSSAEQLRAKVQRAIQAARSADNLLRQRRGEAVVEVPSAPVVPQVAMLDEINADGFVQRTFSSSASAPRASLPDIPLPVVVDLTEEPKLPPGSDLGVMSPVLLEDQEGRQLRWVKKLFALRQKALHGEPMAT